MHLVPWMKILLERLKTKSSQFSIYMQIFLIAYSHSRPAHARFLCSFCHRLLQHSTASLEQQPLTKKHTENMDERSTALNIYTKAQKDTIQTEMKIRVNTRIDTSQVLQLQISFHWPAFCSMLTFKFTYHQVLSVVFFLILIWHDDFAVYSADTCPEY